MFMHGAAPHLPAASTCIMQQVCLLVYYLEFVLGDVYIV